MPRPGLCRVAEFSSVVERQVQLTRHNLEVSLFRHVMLKGENSK
jgi:hypothetical protein